MFSLDKVYLLVKRSLIRGLQIIHYHVPILRQSVRYGKDHHWACCLSVRGLLCRVSNIPPFHHHFPVVGLAFSLFVGGNSAHHHIAVFCQRLAYLPHQHGHKQGYLNGFRHQTDDTDVLADVEVAPFLRRAHGSFSDMQLVRQIVISNQAVGVHESHHQFRNRIVTKKIHCLCVFVRNIDVKIKQVFETYKPVGRFFYAIHAYFLIQADRICPLP